LVSVFDGEKEEGGVVGLFYWLRKSELKRGLRR
jgi:hypothetical protein